MSVRRLIVPAFLMIGLAWLGGCYPSTSKTTTDLDVVVTRYEEDEDFVEYKSYFMPDTVIQLGDPEDDGYIDLEISRSEMDAMLDRVAANMAEFGYIRIMSPIDTIPDAGVFIEALASKVTVVYTYPPGWGWGWYPGYPGWGCCGWYYPPSVGGYSYEVGTLLVNFVDPDKPVEEDGEEFIYTPWIGVGNGLLSSSAGGDRVTNAIDQMFNQSQYLRK